MIVLEICVDSVKSAVAVQEGGASRIELCENMQLGGTTPSAALIRNVREAISIPLHVMIRPRGGDFCFSESEFQAMQSDIETAKQLGADGVVFGILHPDQTIDMERTGELITLARPLAVTFHRAFDATPDLHRSLEVLIKLGVNNVLTAGGAVSVEGGIAALKSLQELSGGRIGILAGGGITLTNVVSVVEQTGVQQIHVYSAVLGERNFTSECQWHSSNKTGITDASKLRELRDQIPPINIIGASR